MLPSTWLATGLLAFLSGPALACPDWHAQTWYGEATLSAGFEPTPFWAGIKGGGTVPLRDCGFEWEEAGLVHRCGLTAGHRGAHMRPLFKTRPKPGSDEEYQWLGATARARGVERKANPYRLPPTLPGDLAMSPEERTRRADLWDIGWVLENAMKRGTSTAVR